MSSLFSWRTPTAASSGPPRDKGRSTPTRCVKVLHIEDNHFQRLLIAHHLGTMQEFEFTINCVESEDAAVWSFRANRFDLVILDYYLKEGNGSSCLYRLRVLDAIVPVIAISGGATAEITSELFELGADSYINKRNMNRQLFTQAVRDALDRAASWRQSLSKARALARTEASNRQEQSLACQ